MKYSCDALRMLMLTVVSCFVSRSELRWSSLLVQLDFSCGSFPLLLAGLTGTCFALHKRMSLLIVDSNSCPGSPNLSSCGLMPEARRNGILPCQLSTCFASRKGESRLHMVCCMCFCMIVLVCFLEGTSFSESKLHMACSMCPWMIVLIGYGSRTSLVQLSTSGPVSALSGKADLCGNL
jgi:hypothetical protein